jgi:hypothetical protein
LQIIVISYSNLEVEIIFQRVAEEQTPLDLESNLIEE